MSPQSHPVFLQTAIPLFLPLTLLWPTHPVDCPSMPLLLLPARIIIPRWPRLLLPPPSFSSWYINELHWQTRSPPLFSHWRLEALRPLLCFLAVEGAWYWPAAAGLQSWWGVALLWVPLVTVVVVGTCCMVVVMIGMMIHTLKILDPGWLALWLCPTGCTVFSCLDSYCLTDYCPNQIDTWLPLRRGPLS